MDAVASMLYYTFSREPKDAGTNIHGGPENLGAIQFLEDLNDAIYHNFEGVQTIAEESSTYPGVTRPVSESGLGFGMKWMMGWMNDTLKYFKLDPINRSYHHHKLTFSITYAFTERFMLPFSHDEVVHGKSSMIYKMPGNEWEKFANLRVLYTYMFTQPGTKLLFMGNEFAQNSEWDFSKSLDWHLLEHESHAGMQLTVKALNKFYRSEPALYVNSFSYDSFEWINADDVQHSVYIYLRKSKKDKDTLIVLINLTPIARNQYKVGVPTKFKWKQVFNTDDQAFFGAGRTIDVPYVPEAGLCHGRPYAIHIDLPPLTAIVLKQTN